LQLYITEKKGIKRKAVFTKCLQCGKKFKSRAGSNEKKRAKFCGTDCSSKSQRNRVKLKCATCGKKFEKKASWLRKSKSGLFFCDKECKRKAQLLSSGITAIHPEHYGKSKLNYRKLAFENYKHKCAVCGWDEDERILQVHHIDGDRKNNNLRNLIILCPTCHCKLTMKVYELTKKNKIIPKDGNKKKNPN
jgi:hypothetical protein